jgi:hypothetical protein
MLTTKFNLCTSFDGTSRADVIQLFESLIDIFQGVVQYNRVSRGVYKTGGRPVQHDLSGCVHNMGSSSTTGSVGVCTTGGRPVRQGPSGCVRQGVIQYNRVSGYVHNKGSSTQEGVILSTGSVGVCTQQGIVQYNRVSPCVQQGLFCTTGSVGVCTQQGVLQYNRVSRGVYTTGGLPV